MAILGIDLGGTTISAGLLENENLVHCNSWPVDKSHGKDGVINQLLQIIESFNEYQIDGIGIGVPSYVDISKGIVYDVVNLPDWDVVPLKDIIQHSFNIPVAINNDANCFVLGEKYFGAALPFSNTVGVTLGTGVGVGIIINNHLYEGMNCGAGEVGCLPYLDKDYEYFTGKSFFTDIHQVEPLDLFEQVKNGDTKAQEIFNSYGHHLGMLIKLLQSCYDPEAIVFGGAIAGAWDHFIHSALATAQDTIFTRFAKNLVVKKSSLENAGIFGAAKLVTFSKNRNT
ncbi:MAG: ROK family protein [Saprospiraceae bacterium]|nr:ROK family protein [Saprospiraceae bacterium]